jgi:hypothetical protein
MRFQDTDTATIYALVDPRNGELRYIGVTVRPLKERLSAHLACGYSGGYGGNAPKSQWIQELRDVDERPIIRALKSVPAPEALETERATIIEYMEAGAKLFNSLAHLGGFPVADGPMRMVAMEVPTTVYWTLHRMGCAGEPRSQHNLGELVTELLAERRKRKEEQEGGR